MIECRSPHLSNQTKKLAEYILKKYNLDNDQNNKDLIVLDSLKVNFKIKIY